jgi:hypothetical protein
MDVVDDDANTSKYEQKVIIRWFQLSSCDEFKILEIVSEGRKMFVCRFRLLVMGVSCSKVRVVCVFCSLRTLCLAN